MIVNYKVLQAAFTKNGISKVRALRWSRAHLRQSCGLAAAEMRAIGWHQNAQFQTR